MKTEETIGLLKACLEFFPDNPNKILCKHAIDSAVSKIEELECNTIDLEHDIKGMQYELDAKADNATDKEVYPDE